MLIAVGILLLDVVLSFLHPNEHPHSEFVVV
jgi:hypothetical protein